LIHAKCFESEADRFYTIQVKRIRLT